MAKGKSKKITIEDALVPVDEQPYDVPENWCWVYGKSILKDMETKKPDGEFFGYIDIDSIDNKNQKVTEAKKTMTSKAPSRASRKLHSGDTVFSMVRPYLKNIAYITEDLSDCIASTGFFVCSPQDNVDSKYLYYLMVSPYVVDGLNAFMKGDNSPSIRKDDIEKFEFPIPPLPEQQRIVEQIERLFSKLDEAKEKAQGILNSFDDTWSAITYAAFTGRLTEKWRERNGKKTDWKEYTLQGVCAMKITDGTHQTPTYCEKEDGGVPFISAKDVTSKTICWDDIKYIVPELHEELYARIAPQIDDVLLAKNGTTGVAAIVDTDKVFDIYVTLAVLRPDKDIIVPRYLYNIVNSPVCKDQFNSHLTGIGVPNLHLRDIKDVKIMVPDKDEQIEVVRLVDRLWDTYLTAYETAKGVVESIDIMKKSILAKAFRGELGTNDSSEESSIELLRQIIES